MIAPLVRWEHSEDWYVTMYRVQDKIKSGERNILISLKDDEYEYLSGHVIDGRNLFPATGYLVNLAISTHIFYTIFYMLIFHLTVKYNHYLYISYRVNMSQNNQYVKIPCS